MARPRQVSDSEILETSRAVFLEHGPSASLARIAKGLGISAPALLKRVGSKDELFLAAMAPTGAATFQRLLREGPIEDASFEDQLTELLVAMTDFLRRVIPRLLMLRSSGKPLALVAAKPRGPAPVRKDLGQWLRRSRAVGLASVNDANALADILVSAVEARCLREHVMDEEAPSDRRWARRTVRALREGLQPP